MAGGGDKYDGDANERASREIECDERKHRDRSQAFLDREAARKKPQERDGGESDGERRGKD